MSIQLQTAVECINLEISVYDDASTDRTWEMLRDWRDKLNTTGIRFTASRNKSPEPRGGNAQSLAL